MTEHPDVLIIGAGVVGASVAWHLATAGVKRIVVIDRSLEPASGSTSRATGGFRAQFGSEINVRLSLLSRAKFLRFSEEVGFDPGYQPAGYLFVAADAAELQALLDAGPAQRRAGFDEVETLDHSSVRRINPALHPDTFVGGTFSPRDGFIRPVSIARGYLSAAVQRGVELQLGVESVSLECRSGRIDSIRTTRGTMHPGAVVNAGGPWARQVVERAGVELPVSPLRRQVACTVPTAALPASTPMTIYSGDGYHFRERDGRILLLWPDDPAEPEDPQFDKGWLGHVEALTRTRIPAIASIPLDLEACHAGLYEMTPDRHAILGRAVELDNLFLANGSSGHGVMHAPALGHLLAELMTATGSSVDVHPLRPSRFLENDPVRGSSLL